MRNWGPELLSLGNSAPNPLWQGEKNYARYKNNCLPTNQVKEDIRKPLWQVLQIINFELDEFKFSENEVLILILIYVQMCFNSLQGWLTGEKFCSCEESKISISEPNHPCLLELLSRFLAHFIFK